MKKHTFPLLLSITFLFLVFTFGFFLGRNRNHDAIYLSALPSVPAHGLPPETADASEATDVTFPVDINTASVEILTSLPGIGETLARRILAYREANGPFSRPEELLNVEGIGPGKLEPILDSIITGG